ncbi:hypothetical protein PAXINDRAFT_176698 [Paxillus involutus ATCC 200175]|uniref:Uncharacterized protein n=1 Tax=Paxillus involutus ATCC 200175 TaxID=664439 RepID=A0A0C9U500_PAXIN|nr:hypothetical protein PAXINDRAFT_176698 [Paxillus involutus ATCC 200175]
MTTTTARGTGNQDINVTSPSPLSPTDDSELSSHPTSASTHTTYSSPPTTPPRGRSAGRYPESLSRVPLHRRGTSKTYERLEDLLREAGYKETRVFTPETERTSATEKQENYAASGVRGGVGAVVGFFAGLVSRPSSLSPEAAPEEDNSRRAELQVWSPPSSPLSLAQVAEERTLHASSSLSPSHHAPSKNLHMSTRRSHVDLSTDTSKRLHSRPAHHVVPLHQSARGLPHHPHPHLRPHPHQQHGHLYVNYSSKPSTKPDTHGARAYLRHMASAPNIQPLTKRPSTSELSLRSHAHGHDRRNDTRRSRPTLTLNDEESVTEHGYGRPRSRTSIRDGDHEAHPPLPRNWIESVARAILSGAGAGAGAGGSAGANAGAVISDTASTKTVSTRKTSSALSDKSNQQPRGRGATRGTRGAKPPLLCAQVQDFKAKTSEGQVSCTRVMCRSAPTSRANSRVRGGAHDEHGNTRNRGKRRQRDAPAGSRSSKGKDKDADIVPSLARTSVENDEWTPRRRYLGGWGIDTHPQQDGASSDDNDDDDEEEDEEGELGLDRLLVPARRQHSIQSLRRHLHRPRSGALNSRGIPPPTSPRSGRLSPFGAVPPTGRQDWGDASWSTSRGRQWVGSEGDEDEGYGHVFSGSQTGTGRSSIKRRRGIPGPWAQWTTSP